MPIEFPLRSLRYALALEKTGHFGRAAEACNVSQPALSMQIRALEEASRTPLFERASRKARPTPFGREFLDRARAVIAAADALERLVETRAGIPLRPMRFGLIPTVAPYLLPDLVPALQRDLPGVTWAMNENRTGDLLDGLSQDDLDVALIASDPPADFKLDEESVLTDDFVLATADKGDGDGSVELSAIPPERILLLEEGHCFRDQTIAACKMERALTNRPFAATSLSTIVALVASGQGITLLPRISVRREGSDPRIHVRPLASPGAGRTLRLVWRVHSPYEEIFRTMAAVIRGLRATVAQAERS